MKRWLLPFVVVGAFSLGTFSLIFAAEKKPGFLGIMHADAEHQGVKGAGIGRVLDNTAAAKAKLKINDIITAVNEMPVAGTDSFQRLLGRFKAGDEIVFEVHRNGKNLTVTAVLGVRPPAFPVSDKQKPPRVPSGNIVPDRGGTLTVGGLDNSDNLIVNGGKVHVRGDFRQGWMGLLDFEITGDRNKSAVLVDGKMELGGNLYVHLAKGVKPKPGSAFEVVSGAKGSDGKFGRLLLPKLPKSLEWKIHYDDVKNGRDFDKDGKHDVTLVVVPKRNFKKKAKKR